MRTSILWTNISYFLGHSPALVAKCIVHFPTPALSKLA
jgi:hypothetical protein